MYGEVMNPSYFRYSSTRPLVEYMLRHGPPVASLHRKRSPWTAFPFPSSSYQHGQSNIRFGGTASVKCFLSWRITCLLSIQPDAKVDCDVPVKCIGIPVHWHIICVGQRRSVVLVLDSFHYRWSSFGETKFKSLQFYTPSPRHSRHHLNSIT